MTQRYDAVAVREYEHNGEPKKTYIRLGAAFPFKDGKDGFTVKLDAVPAPQDGTYTILCFPPKPRDQQNTGPARPTYDEVSKGGVSGVDDEIPF